MCDEIFDRHTPVEVPSLEDYSKERRAFIRAYNDLCVEVRRSNRALAVILVAMLAMSVFMVITQAGG